MSLYTPIGFELFALKPTSFSSSLVRAGTMAAWSRGTELAFRVGPVVMASLPWVGASVLGTAVVGGVGYFAYRCLRKAPPDLPPEILAIICEMAVENFKGPEDLESIFRLRRVSPMTKYIVDKAISKLKNERSIDLHQIHRAIGQKKRDLQVKRQTARRRALRATLLEGLRRMVIMPFLASAVVELAPFVPGLFAGAMVFRAVDNVAPNTPFPIHTFLTAFGTIVGAMLTPAVFFAEASALSEVAILIAPFLVIPVIAAYGLYNLSKEFQRIEEDVWKVSQIS